MFGGLLSNFRQLVIKTPQIQPVRFRYYAAKKEYIRRHGYVDKYAQGGLIPHTGERRVYQLPVYK